MWEKAGGRDAALRSFMQYNEFDKNLPSQVWTLVTHDLFSVDKKELTKWLKIIWKEDRRGVQTAVLCAGNFLQLNYILYLFIIYFLRELVRCVLFATMHTILLTIIAALVQAHILEFKKKKKIPKSKWVSIIVNFFYVKPSIVPFLP